MVNHEKRKQRRRARRAKYIALLGGKCMRCGTNQNLEFDHIKKKTKSIDIANSIDTKEDAFYNEIKKCQLLCKECHKAKTNEDWDYGVDKSRHGTIWMYKKYKCRCDDCRHAMSQYYRSKLASIIARYEKLVKRSDGSK